MPYNTRRKSLSLPSLGIHVPVTHAARAAAAAANRSSPSSANSPRSPAVASMAAPPAPTSSSRDDTHPNKKLKRTFSDSEDSDSAHPSEPKPKRRDGAKKFEHTLPPSPPADRPSVEMEDVDTPAPKTIDMDSINDEIVEAVVVQLQQTGNRPHLVKELAAILMQQLKIVQQSANPCAIISSRLSTFLKRSCWSAASPCPLTKELETVHPRRTYFYLTTCPHQPLPDPAHAATLSQLAHTRTIISPSLSSATSGSGSEDADPERRRELSPSPEVDLSSPEFDDMDDDIAMPSTPIGSLSMRGLHFRGHHSGSSRHHRAASPPLEKDEKEFTQTADGLQKRKLSGNLLTGTTTTDHPMPSIEMDFGNRDDAGLFGEKAMNITTVSPMTFVTSPAMRPLMMSLNFGKKDGEADNWAKLDQLLEWDRSPENIELEELDGLLNDY